MPVPTLNFLRQNSKDARRQEMQTRFVSGRRSNKPTTSNNIEQLTAFHRGPWLSAVVDSVINSLLWLRSTAYEKSCWRGEEEEIKGL